MPADVPDDTLIVPSAFNVRPDGTVTDVKVISEAFTLEPFNSSLDSTEPVVPPV